MPSGKPRSSPGGSPPAKQRRRSCASAGLVASAGRRQEGLRRRPHRVVAEVVVSQQQLAVVRVQQAEAGEGGRGRVTRHCQSAAARRLEQGYGGRQRAPAVALQCEVRQQPIEEVLVEGVDREVNIEVPGRVGAVRHRRVDSAHDVASHSKSPLDGAALWQAVDECEEGEQPRAVADVDVQHLVEPRRRGRRRAIREPQRVAGLEAEADAWRHRTAVEDDRRLPLEELQAGLVADRLKGGEEAGVLEHLESKLRRLRVAGRAKDNAQVLE